MKLTDPGVVFGFCLLFVLFVITESVAIGKVDPSSSFGLPALIECFKTLVTVFATWMYVKSTDTQK
jgi:hypothetical protein